MNDIKIVSKNNIIDLRSNISSSDIEIIDESLKSETTKIQVTQFGRSGRIEIPVRIIQEKDSEINFQILLYILNNFKNA